MHAKPRFAAGSEVFILQKVRVRQANLGEQTAPLTPMPSIVGPDCDAKSVVAGAGKKRLILAHRRPLGGDGFHACKADLCEDFLAVPPGRPVSLNPEYLGE